MVTSLRNAIKAVLGFKDDIAQGKNPTRVTTAQVNTYTRLEVDNQLAGLLGNGDLPLSQYGDLGFSAPNVSSRYEGATTTHCPIVYQVEQDGSRNYLRNGMDGQTAGVYLCKFFVDANMQMTGYSPMATPWRPAWLPADDTIAELIHTAPGYVAVRCIGSFNGKLPAGSVYFAISYGNGTLNPELHVNYRVLTGLSQAGMDGRYLPGYSTLVLDNNGTGGYLIRVPTGIDFGGPIQMEILLLTSLTATTLTPATEVVGYTGTDCLGVTQSAANSPVVLASLGAVVGSGTAYFVRANNDPGFGAFQTQPIFSVLQHSGNMLTLSMQHETWASRSDGASDRRVVTRVIVINLTAKTYTVNTASRGPVNIGNVNGQYLIQGTPVTYNQTGIPLVGNRQTGWARCNRTGEVLAQSTQPTIGNCALRYIPAPGTGWLSPWLRSWETAQLWEYVPNYPSPVGAAIGFPTPISTGLRIHSTVGYTDVTSPNYAAPIDYVYPDGSTGKWAVDSGRTPVAAGWVPTRTMTVVPKNGTVRHVGSAVRGVGGFATVPENGPGTGFWKVDDTTDAKLMADMQATMGSKMGWTGDFCCYRPGAIGHYTNPLVVIGYGVDNTNQAFAYSAIYEITAMSGSTVTGVSTAKLSTASGAVAWGVVNSSPMLDTHTTSPMIIAEASDYVFLGGSSPWLVSYIGNSGQPSQALAITASGYKRIREYQAHTYINSETIYFIPGKGPAAQNLAIDNQFAITVMTMVLFGNTYATAEVNQGVNLVAATQAVYGSWNLYFAEEVRCQITGVTGRMPKKTVDLRTVKANPANTTFYLYAKLTNGTFDYIVSATVLAADKTMVPIGTTVTNNTQIASVAVQKTFSIDGFSLSQNLVAYAIPNSAGLPFDNTAIIHWPGVAV